MGSLIDKELITAVGRLDAPGRPMLYGTTEKFLRVFGLSSISELPEAGSIEAAISSLTETGEEAGEEAGTAGDGSADESGDTPDGEDTLPGES